MLSDGHSVVPISDTDFIPDKVSRKDRPCLTNLHVSFKKLADIAEFDFNESHLSNLASFKYDNNSNIRKGSDSTKSDNSTARTNS